MNSMPSISKPKVFKMNKAVLSIFLTVILSMIPASTLCRDGALLYESKVFKVEDEPGLSGRLVTTFFFEISPANARSILESQLDSLAKVFPPTGDFVGRANLKVSTGMEPSGITFSDGTHEVRLRPAAEAASVASTHSVDSDQMSEAASEIPRNSAELKYCSLVDEYLGLLNISMGVVGSRLEAFNVSQATEGEVKEAFKAAMDVEMKSFRKYMQMTFQEPGISGYNFFQVRPPDSCKDLDSRIKTFHVIWQTALEQSHGLPNLEKLRDAEKQRFDLTNDFLAMRRKFKGEK